MTIITKPITDKKPDKLGESLVANEALPGKTDLEANDESLLPPPGTQYLMRARRVTTATTVCLFLTALLVMSIGIIGGVYLYRQFARSQMHRFRGWCSIPYESSLLMDDNAKLGRRENSLSDSRLFKSVQPDYARMSPADSFKEEFVIDPLENYETITVPDFRAGRTGRFIHDFNANKTGIVDLEGKRCFVMPLNRDAVLPPRSLFDLITKIWDGYYEVNTETVRETMRVVLPRISDYRSLGQYISRECHHLPTYMLEKYNARAYKRQADDEENFFSEFAGLNIQEVDIINLPELEEYERNNPHPVALPLAEQSLEPVPEEH